MFVDLCEDMANYKAYYVAVNEEDPQYWVVASWFKDSKVTDHNEGDLFITEWEVRWDRHVKVRGERKATSLERAWLETLIEVYDYRSPVRTGVTLLNSNN